MTHTVTVNEEQRQLVLMALANLAVLRPGFDWALGQIASKLDNVVEGRPQTYEQFKALAANRRD